MKTTTKRILALEFISYYAALTVWYFRNKKKKEREEKEFKESVRLFGEYVESLKEES